MSPKLPVRIASALVLLHAVLHTVGGVFGEVAPGPATVAATAMKANSFVAFGKVRTFWDFHIGFGLGITIFLTVEAFALWFLAPLTEKYPRDLVPVLAVFALGYLVFAVNSWRFFFLGPVVAEVLIAVCLLVALFLMRASRGSAR